MKAQELPEKAMPPIKEHRGGPRPSPVFRCRLRAEIKVSDGLLHFMGSIPLRKQ